MQFKRGASAFQGMASGEEAAQIVMLERALHSERCDSFGLYPNASRRPSISVLRVIFCGTQFISSPDGSISRLVSEIAS